MRLNYRHVAAMISSIVLLLFFTTCRTSLIFVNRVNFRVGLQASKRLAEIIIIVPLFQEFLSRPGTSLEQY